MRHEITASPTPASWCRRDKEEGRPVGRPSSVLPVSRYEPWSASSGGLAGADDAGRGLGPIGEDGGRMGLELAIRAFRGEDPPFVDGEVEGLNRAAAAGDLRDR